MRRLVQGWRCPARACSALGACTGCWHENEKNGKHKVNLPNAMRNY